MAVGAVLLALGAPAAVAAERPVVYVVVIDGLDGDRVDQGRAPFISSLLADSGTYYQESRSVMIAETNPNHVAMMTGAYGGSSGIPGNAFAVYAPLQSHDTCAATGPPDRSKRPAVTSGQSPTCLKAQSVFEAIKRQGNPEELTTAAIFGKPKLGRIFAGKFFDGRNRDVDYMWAPCSSGADDDEYCDDVATNPATGYAADDKTVMDEVLRVSRQGAATPGGIRRPDLFFVNLHQVDSAGHGTGTGGVYDAAIAQADDQIERLVTDLKSRGQWSRSVLIMVSDHSMDTTLKKTTLASRFESAGIAESDYVVVQDGSADAVYLADRTSAGRFELLERLRAAALGTEGVDEALYREPNPADGGRAHTIDAAHPAWNLAGERSADLLVTHEPAGAFSDPGSFDNPLAGNHGGPQTTDNFFAIAGGGQAVRAQSLAGSAAPPRYDDTRANPGQAENVDVAPTVMGLFGLLPARDSQGRFLRESFDLERMPGGGEPALRPTLRVRQVRQPRRRRGGRRSAAAARRSSCTRRYRVEAGPAGGLYDVQVRSGRRPYRALLTRASRRRVVFRGSRGRRYRLRARLYAASGKRSAFAYSKRVGPRGRGCTRR
jgi:Type I phosphodiesterase / nucleotide pyrophosphatase